MKINKIAIYTFLVFSLMQAKPSRAQQNIQFSQYIFNALSVNPAYAGYKEEWFTQLALRQQWVGIDGAPKTGQLSIDGIASPESKKVGLGLQLTADKLGPQSSTSAYANYAYRLPLNSDGTSRLSFGIGVGVTQYRLDVSEFDPINPNDAVAFGDNIKSTVPDARFGVYYASSTWYLGASVNDLLSGGDSGNIFDWTDNGRMNIKRKRHIYVIGGFLTNLSTDVKLRPSILWKEDFKGPSSLDLSAMLVFKNKFWIGGAYRTGVVLWDKDYRKQQQLSDNNSIAGIAQFYATDRLRIGYSYDYVVSKLSSVQHGSHEITVGLTFGRDKRLTSVRFF